MPNSFQIFLFKIDGIAETKPPPTSRQSSRLEGAVQLSQIARQLSQLEPQVSSLLSGDFPLSQRMQIAIELSQLAPRVREIAMQIRESDDASEELRRLTSEMSRISNEVSQLATDLSQEDVHIQVLFPTLHQFLHSAAQLSRFAVQLNQSAAELSRPADERFSVSTDENTVRELNRKADEIAQRLQQEIARLLRSSVSVQAEIRFYEGSILLEGTITIISWLAPIALASARKSFEDGLKHIIGAAARRVLQPILRAVAPQAEPIREIEVTSQPVGSASTPSMARSLPLFLQRIPRFDGSGVFLIFMILSSIVLTVLIVLVVTFIIMLASGSPRRTGILVGPAGALSPVVVHSKSTVVSLPVRASFFHLPESKTS